MYGRVTMSFRRNYGKVLLLRLSISRTELSILALTLSICVNVSKVVQQTVDDKIKILDRKFSKMTDDYLKDLPSSQITIKQIAFVGPQL